MVDKIKTWFAYNFVCMGEHTPEPHITDYGFMIKTKRCAICKVTLGIGKSTTPNPPPPKIKRYKK